MDLLRLLYVLPHLERSCRFNAERHSLAAMAEIVAVGVVCPSKMQLYLRDGSAETVYVLPRSDGRSVLGWLLA